MYLREAVEQAAERETSALHRDGRHRIKWVESLESLMYERMRPDGEWDLAGPAEARETWPRAGWHVRRNGS